MILADFEPGLFFLLLWGLISWLTRKKKKKIDTDSGEVITKPKKDLFVRIKKLQEHLSQEVDIFPTAPPPLDAKEGYFTEDDEYVIEEPEVLELELEDLDENKEFAFIEDIKVPTKGKGHENWLKQNLFQKSNLRNLMVLREILGEPRSLKPYTGDYFSI